MSVRVVSFPVYLIVSNVCEIGHSVTTYLIVNDILETGNSFATYLSSANVHQTGQFHYLPDHQ